MEFAERKTTQGSELHKKMIISPAKKFCRADE